ncbi:hypothetical protein [[Mycobacterium] holstebronense]|uniref:DUF4830 domain-containing protein n=1 Tax=[Mycobacterium] holstebronense TaxID=3064288 RepID=A0ABM9LEA8_9MYCO|nr:hypothetical protein [Mycolicibacter sp. MU0102]CAJ1497544.1 hypothetical protein MU0102_000493 [Mycolicibacter sp. MU0102]
MKASKAMVISAAVVVGIVIVLAGYVFWQYRSAAPPALGDSRVYAQSADIPVTSVPDHAGAEKQLREFADGIAPGYRVADERFLASGVPLVWDALRHFVGPDLSRSGYALTADGFATDFAIEYSVYGHSGGIRRWFNDDLILIAGFNRPAVPAAADPDAYLYGYFRLART